VRKPYSYICLSCTKARISNGIPVHLCRGPVTEAIKLSAKVIPLIELTLVNSISLSSIEKAYQYSLLRLAVNE
jgi:hypothetical protein